MMRQTKTASAPQRCQSGSRWRLLACAAVLAIPVQARPEQAIVDGASGAASPAALAVPAPTPGERAGGPAAVGLPVEAGIVVAGSPPAPSGDEDRALPPGGAGDRVVKAAVTAIPAPRGKGINREFVEEVFAEICRLGIREPQIVMRQAILETGWLRAPFLMKRNNLFGFRYRSYLTFDDWRDSVRYYRDWQARRYKASDPSYYAFLTRIRYGAPNYLEHLRKIRWERECAPPPSPLKPTLPVEPAAPPAQTLAHPDLPSRVESVVPPLLGDGAGAAAPLPSALSVPPVPAGAEKPTPISPVP